MSPTPITPCDGLSLEDRALRLSQQMVVLGDAIELKHAFVTAKRRAGYCTLCGSQLAVTYRAVKCVVPACEECPNGTFVVAEATHAPESLARFEEWKSKAVPDSYGWPDGFHVVAVYGCGSLNDATFREARRIAAERHAKLRDGAQSDKTGTARKDKARAALAANEF